MTVTIKAKALEAFVADIFATAGCSKEEGARIGRYLVSANLSGHDSHGVVRVPRYASQKKAGTVVADVKVDVLVDTPVVAVVDGKYGFGQTVAPLSVDIGVADANLYPNITLNGTISQDALTPQTIFAKASDSYNFGPALTLPIFHSGQLHARKREAEDAARAALLAYEETVLEAFAQVDDALQAIAHDNQAFEDQTRVLDLAQARLDMVRKSFAIGGSTARQLLAAQKALVQAQLDLQQNGTGRYADAARLMLAVAHVPPGAAAGTRTP